MLIYHSDDAIPHSHLPFTPAVQVGNLLFVSGQASVDLHGNIVSDDFEGEMRRAVGNLESILSHCGSDLNKVVKTHNYLGGGQYRELFNEIYSELFPEPFPARTTVAKELPGGLKFEIDCVAYVDSG